MIQSAHVHNLLCMCNYSCDVHVASTAKKPSSSPLRSPACLQRLPSLSIYWRTCFWDDATPSNTMASRCFHNLQIAQSHSPVLSLLLLPVAPCSQSLVRKRCSVRLAERNANPVTDFSRKDAAHQKVVYGLVVLITEWACNLVREASHGQSLRRSTPILECQPRKEMVFAAVLWISTWRRLWVRPRGPL